MNKNKKVKKPMVEPIMLEESAISGISQSELFDWRTFEPAMLEGGAEAPLATELVTYRDHLDELLRHEGQYVVIRDQEIAGYFRDFRSAVGAAIAAYGSGPVLIKKVVEREPIRWIDHAGR
jgi:hypothetical protein